MAAVKRALTKGKLKFECLFCGHRFQARIPASYEVRCPKCREYDVEVA